MKGKRIETSLNSYFLLHKISPESEVIIEQQVWDTHQNLRIQIWEEPFFSSNQSYCKVLETVETGETKRTSKRKKRRPVC